ncbi:hypothetical protein L1049_023264 [Liquidambar formosana]|uniref:Uncharacterized protein n=1 Tax=Liquidambar formosana TaxID=63359 RepID=A0AAP0REK8_LIQFO
MFNGNLGEHHIDVFLTTSGAPPVASHLGQPSQPPQQPIDVSDDEIEVEHNGSEDGSEDCAEKGGYCEGGYCGEGEDEVYGFTDDSNEDGTYVEHENEEGDGDIDDEHDGDFGDGDDYIFDELSDYQSNSSELKTSSGSEDEDFQVDPNRFMRGKKPVEDDARKVSFWVGRVFVSVDAFREKENPEFDERERQARKEKKLAKSMTPSKRGSGRQPTESPTSLKKRKQLSMDDYLTPAQEKSLECNIIQFNLWQQQQQQQVDILS